MIDNKAFLILQEEISTCDLHVERISMALRRINALFPMTEQSIDNLSEENLGFLEILTSRFYKLQENIGQKIFPALLKILKEDIENKSFLDRLNKLEKLQIIPSAIFWDQLREARNILIHEYEKYPIFQVQAMNNCFVKTKELLDYWQFLKEYIALNITPFAETV